MLKIEGVINDERKIQKNPNAIHRKTGYHGLKHRKVYEISIVSMYGKFWVEVGDEAIAYVSLAMLCRNWVDV